MDIQFRSYPGWSHTDAILEAIMEGNHQFHSDLFELIEEWTGGTSTSKSDTIVEFPNDGHRRLCYFVDVARWCMVF